ncbi:MAG: acyltransferase family protein, partial [Acidimicrobiales bacterium]
MPAEGGSTERIVAPAARPVEDTAPPVSGDAAPAPASSPFVLGNRPALTGIRAIALAFIVVFHSNFRTFPGAWVSLEVFFVLSGFLITSMLAREHQKNGRISLGTFYGRRAVRLLPPLVLTVALLALYALIVPVANAGSRIWGDSASVLLYVSDYRSAFFHEPNLGFLAQCWSVAVEEQFYLVWAILLVVALKFGNRRLGYALAVFGIVASTANRVWMVLGDRHWGPVSAARVYYAVDTRADALFVGCL